MLKETPAESKITFKETGKVELIVKVPNLIPANAAIIARDVRLALENSAKLNLLNEFSAGRTVEYKEVEGT